MCQKVDDERQDIVDKNKCHDVMDNQRITEKANSIGVLSLTAT